MSKLVKFFLVFVIICTMSFTFKTFINISQASFMDDIIKSGDDFVNTGKSSKINTINGTKFKSTVNKVYRVFMIVGIGISVIISAIVAIKIMIGSAVEKAEMKEQLTPYIIGVAVIFGSLAIWTAVMKLAGNL